jgi:hypothetical protein
MGISFLREQLGSGLLKKNKIQSGHLPPFFKKKSYPFRVFEVQEQLRSELFLNQFWAGMR